MRSLISRLIRASGMLASQEGVKAAWSICWPFDLVDRFRLNYPGQEMWTRFGDSPSGQIRSYLDRVLDAQTVTSLKQSLSKLFWRDWSPMACRQICYHHPRNGGLGMPDLESHWLTERLAYLGLSLSRDPVWSQKVRDAFPCLESSPQTEGRRQPRGEVPFACECRKALWNLPGSSDLSRPRKELYRELVVGSASDALVMRLGCSLGEVRSQLNWAPGSSFSKNSEFSLTWRLSPNTLALNDWAFRAGLADTPDCPRSVTGLEETALHAFYNC